MRIPTFLFLASSISTIVSGQNTGLFTAFNAAGDLVIATVVTNARGVAQATQIVSTISTAPARPAVAAGGGAQAAPTTAAVAVATTRAAGAVAAAATTAAAPPAAAVAVNGGAQAALCTTAGCKAPATTYSQETTIGGVLTTVIMTFVATTPPVPLPSRVSSGKVLGISQYITTTLTPSLLSTSGSRASSAGYRTVGEWGSMAIAGLITTVGGMMGALLIL